MANDTKQPGQSRPLTPAESRKFRAELARAGDLIKEFEKAQLVCSFKADGSIVPGPGLTLADVFFMEGSLERAAGRQEAARKAAKAPRPGRRSAVMDKRATRYAEIKRVHPGWSDETIASLIAKEFQEPDGGALKRVKRSLKRKP